MITVYLCVGSSCYVRGSDQVAMALQRSIAGHELQDDVDVVGTFCLDHCSMGVTIKIEDQVFEGVQPEGVDALFEQEILPRVAEMRRPA
jgi:NADH:ubiquinone oxidoreductase subunit E